MTTRRLALPVVVICMLAQLVATTGASADAPVVYGWWSQTSLGAGGAAPPDVPADGMFVQNFPPGPGAISALEFRLPAQGADSSPTSITLQITGTPIITQPPVICAATSGFEAAQGGAWSERPSYDCSQSVMGVVDADQTRVEFAVDRLVGGSTLSLVVLAGGPVDRIPLKRPDFETLTQISSDSGGVVDTGAPPPTAPADPPPTSPVVTEAPVFPEADVPEVTSTSEPREDVESAAPVVAVPEPTQKTSNAAVDMIGLLLIVLCILYWSDGFGALPLRSSRVILRQLRTR